VFHRSLANPWNSHIALHWTLTRFRHARRCPTVAVFGHVRLTCATLMLE
jgi:hypothetical protein